LICRWLLWRGIKTFVSPQTLANSDCPAGAATGPMSYSVGSLQAENGGDELFVKLACLVYAGEFAFLMRVSASVSAMSFLSGKIVKSNMLLMDTMYE